ncbi:MAG: bifunctional diguanylate cyclase/phosphodiesterase [Pseudomonadota bacterium]
MTPDDPTTPDSARAIKRSVTFGLIAQVLLSLGLLVVSIQLDRTKHLAASYLSLVSEHRLVFRDAADAARRLSDAIAMDNPDARLIRRIQESLAVHSADLRAIIDRIERAADTKYVIQLGGSGMSARAFEDIQPEFEILLADLDALSTLAPSDLFQVRQYAAWVGLAVAPTGAISTGIDVIIATASEEADLVTSQLRMLRTGLFIVCVALILCVGVGLIFPALRDLSGAHQRERSLRLSMLQMARRDRMTGLRNRAGFEEVLAGYDADQVYCLAVIDLNMFKPINDTYGHRAGDAVLIEIAARLRLATAGEVVVGRIGGDEFAVLDPTGRDLMHCTRMGKALAALFNRPIEFEDREFPVSAAIGIALSSDTAPGYEAVLTAADAAMYAAKADGDTAARIFDATLAADLPDLARKTEIEAALQSGEIGPWYQPKFDLRTGEAVGFEALCRWQRRNGDVLLPAAFLPDIDKYDLHMVLSLRMIGAVLAQLRAWSEAGLDPPPVAVNVPAQTLASSTGLQDFAWQITEYKDVSHLLFLEITEDAYLPRIATMVQRSIQGIAGLGVRIAIDDFGSGYASFRHLSESTFHELKIDSSFVRGIGVDPSAEIVIGAFMAVAKGLDVAVVAEGIETEEQRKFLRNQGCDVGQGFLFSPAVPVADATNWLRPQDGAKEAG